MTKEELEFKIHQMKRKIDKQRDLQAELKGDLLAQKREANAVGLHDSANKHKYPESISLENPLAEPRPSVTASIMV